MSERTSRRYQPLGTEVNFLLLKVEEEGGAKRQVVLVDNNDWFLEAESLGIPTHSPQAYREYMAAHDGDYFSVPPALYAELEAKVAPPVPVKYSSLDDKELLEKYCQSQRAFYTLAPQVGADWSLVRSLLERGFWVRLDCEAGILKIVP